VFGVWCLVFGVWCLVFGVWCLVFGVWCSVFGVGGWGSVLAAVSGNGGAAEVSFSLLDFFLYMSWDGMGLVSGCNFL